MTVYFALRPPVVSVHTLGTPKQNGDASFQGHGGQSGPVGHTLSAM
jgi:hypothetical protein